MIDKNFEMKGGFVAEDYVFDLWNEVVRLLPWLNTEDRVGFLPLRGSESNGGLLLSLRSKLVLRLPVDLSVQANALAGQELQVGSCVLHLGTVTDRPLQPYSTLHSKLVKSEECEEVFLNNMASQLDEMEIKCQWICGKRQAISGAGQKLQGYSLVLHDLKPEDSLQIQRAGLGGARHYGCGIFVPYKTISDLN